RTGAPRRSSARARGTTYHRRETRSRPRKTQTGARQSRRAHSGRRDPAEPPIVTLASRSANSRLGLKRHRRPQSDRPSVSRGGQAVFGDAPERLERVAPADLLALGVGAAVIGNWHLVHPHAERGDFRRDLRLEPESILPELDGRKDLAAEHLVA